jgi:deoxyribose-phosphate aldolase
MRSNAQSTPQHRLSKKIDHAVLHPAATEDDFLKGADIALAYDTATYCVPSFMVRTISERLATGNVATCAVVGFPHGNVHSSVKIHEAIRAVEDGATEVDMVVNIGLVQSARLQHVEREIDQVNRVVTDRGALLKVILETCYLTDDATVRLCSIAAERKVAFVKTSTGFGPAGATLHHVALMRKSVPATMGIKASGGIRTLSDVQRFLEAGATRIGTSSTAAILDEAARLLSR